MPNIHTIVKDIYSLVGGPDGITSLPSDMGDNVASAIATSLGPQKRRGLRLSAMGPRCPRALWYAYHHPELEEGIPPYARIKYTYGHIIEHLVIGLAKAAGHEVTGEQDEIVVDGVSGHRDCVIDGCIVDVKSTSSRGFLKFRDKTIAQDDPFGYLDQLDGYAVGSLDDALVRVKDKAYLLAVDKQLGHMALYEHTINEQKIRARIAECKDVVARTTPPKCTCGTVPDGKSGNIKLDLRASYSGHKHNCFPNLRTFLYSDGPRHLVKVIRLPDVTEVDKHGKVVYHA